MCYHSHREKSKKRKSTDDEVVRFDKKDYDEIMKKIDTFNHSEEVTWEHFGNVVGFQTVNQYLCDVKEILTFQRDNGLTNLTNEDLMTDRVNKLLALVISRKEKVSKAMFKERTTSEFQPFKVAPEVAKIEYYLWEYASKNIASCASALRDRYHYLMTLGGVLRSESMYLADLSDLCDFIFHQTLEPDPYHVSVLRIGRGKTNKANNIFGRAMRHKDPRMCSVSGLGLYLLARFQSTNEVDELFDFTKNKTWFNIKLLRSMQKRKKSKKITKSGKGSGEGPGMYKCCSINVCISYYFRMLISL